MFWDPFTSLFPGTSSPEVDLVENKKQFVLAASLPQVDKASLKVQPEADHTICISGNRTLAPLPGAEESDEGGRYRSLLRERSSGAFHRCFRLPHRFAAENVSATLKNDELTVILPKKWREGKDGSPSIDIVHAD